MDNSQRILFITPIQHLRNFYGYVLQNHTIIEMVNPTYDDVKIQLPNWDILFCAPNHQTFVIDEELVKDTDIKCILTPSTGVNHIDVESIPIISLKGDKILDDVWSTAEHTLYLILSIVRGKHELHDKTLGIIGYGRLGKMVEKLCKPLFKKIITIDKKSKISELSEFYKDSDVVSIHMDLNPTTENLIGNDFLSFFSKSIYLINTARGEIVNEHDIKHLLSVGRIKGYATDVLQSEYTGEKSIFDGVENVIVTPHIAGTSPEAQEKTYKRVLEKYEIYFNKTLNNFLETTEYKWIKNGFVRHGGKYLSALHYIVKYQPKVIVEYGGGQSTFMITELVNYLDYGGKVIAYESDEYWYNDHIKEGWNKYNNINLVEVEETTEDEISGIRYIHPLEDIEGVDFVIIDGPDLRGELWKNNPRTTFNLMDIVNHIGYEIPFFIDGRMGTRGFYKDFLEYTTDIGDVSYEDNS